MVFRCISRFGFFFSSTNQHGVHSPFVYNYLTKCLYAKPRIEGKKHVQVLLKSIHYFDVKSLQIWTKSNKLATRIGERFPALKTSTPPYDLIFSNITDWSKLEKALSESALVHDQSMLLLTDIYQNKKSRKLWKTAVNSSEFNVSIDMYYCGALFKRKEQRKQHFKVRI